MNKLAVVALTILLFCGSALWYLANLSFNDAIVQHIEKQTFNNLKLVTEVKSLTINKERTLGHIQQIHIIPENDVNQAVAIVLSNISFNIHASDENSRYEIKALSIEDFSVKANNKTDINAFLTKLKQQIELQNDTVNSVKPLKPSFKNPLIAIPSLVIDKLIFNLNENNELLTFNKIELVHPLDNKALATNYIDVTLAASLIPLLESKVN